MEDEACNLRRGWTTGACAAAAAKAAVAALRGDDFPDPVTIALPGGQTPAFALAVTEKGSDFARAGIIKDAGDDPDVTHGALIISTVRNGVKGSGITFKGGEGVGQVTLAGLPIPPGEPAINPVPRQMIAQAIADIAGEGADYEVEISVPDGEAMAAKTLNGRLGILGGISILGTTGIVIPYSCSSWIHSILRGIDVARAAGLTHIAGATGSASEVAVQAYHSLPEIALIDMGDFVGGMLKHLRAHPIDKVTVAGGVAKMTKLAQGMLDLHSKRGAPDMEALARVAEAFGHARQAGFALGDIVAQAAWDTAADVLKPADMALEILIFDREGQMMGQAAFASVHNASRPLNRR